jgi:hypothetical protein
MGDGPRVRRAYRVLGATQVRGGQIALGCVTWNINAEPMSATSAREEIAAGITHWGIIWDSRKPKTRPAP